MARLKTLQLYEGSKISKNYERDVLLFWNKTHLRRERVCCKKCEWEMTSDLNCSNPVLKTFIKTRDEMIQLRKILFFSGSKY
jgi:hypothetical protein